MMALTSIAPNEAWASELSVASDVLKGDRLSSILQRRYVHQFFSRGYTVTSMSVPLSFDESVWPFLQKLARFETTRELERSSLYRELKPDLDLIIGNVWRHSFAV